MTARPPDPTATTGTASMTGGAVPTSGDSDGSDATRIILVDDHSIVREGLRRLLETTSDIRVVAEAGSVADAIQIARTVDSDVIVMDVRLVDGSGVVASRVIRSERPTIRVILLTSMSDEEALFLSIMAGASGYVLKQIRGNALVQAIRRTAAGESLIDHRAAVRALSRLQTGDHDAFRALRLTPEQRRIVEMVADGLTNRQISGRLDQAEQAVAAEIAAVLSSDLRAELAAIIAARLPRPHPTEHRHTAAAG